MPGRIRNLFHAVSLFVAALLVAPAFSQKIDSRGDEFVFSFIHNIFSSTEVVEIYLSADTPTEVTVEYPMNSPTFTTTVSLTPGDVSVVSLPREASNAWAAGPILDNAVRAYSASGTEFGCALANMRSGSSDAAMALPVDALGTEYVVATYDLKNNIHADLARSEMIVTAVQDDTSVTITPSVRIVGTGGVYDPGSSVTLTLHRGESFFGQDTAGPSTPAPGLAGTTVTSDKPVAVVSGNRCTAVTNGIFGGCSHLLDMALPTTYWSSEILVPTLPGFAVPVVRVFSAQDATEVRRGPGSPLFLGTLDRGDYLDTSIFNAGGNIVNGTNPILVQQFSQSAGSFPQGGPALSPPLPVEQYDNRYTFRTIGDGRFGDHRATILASGRDIGTLSLDGVVVPESEFNPFNGSVATSTEAICFYAVNLPIAEGVHRTSSRHGHWVRVVGKEDNIDGYHYSAGAWFDRPPITDAAPPRATFEIDGPTAIFHATDDDDEDLNENLLLDAGEDFNGDGVLNMDSGILQVALVPDLSSPLPGNLRLNDQVIRRGKSTFDFTVSLIDPCSPGRANVRLTDCSGNFADILLQIPSTCGDDPPVVDPPPDVTVEATGPLTPVDLGAATANDAQDGPLPATPDNAGPFPLGTTVVTWSATDTSGNIATAEQRVRVVDTTPPTVVAPPDVTAIVTGALTVAELRPGLASAADLVDGELEPSPDTAGPFPVGVTLVTWTATDSSGNTGFDVQRVQVMIRIDVKPHSFPSCFRIDGDGTVPVAIFGEEGFDVHDIDERSLVFEGLIVKQKNNGDLQCATELVDGDPYVDLVCHFADDPTQWTGAEPEGLLTGETLAGTGFQGVGDICLTND